MTSICFSESVLEDWPYSNDSAGVSKEANVLNEQKEEIYWDIRNVSSFLEKKLPLETVYLEANENGWDGYEAEGVKFATFKYALKFLSLLPSKFEAPEFTPESDGEISIEWKKSRQSIFSISVGCDGRLTYVGFFGQSRTKGVEYLYDEIPKTILSNIERILD